MYLWHTAALYKDGRRRLSARSKPVSFPSPHLSFERLTDLVEGRVSANEQAGVHSHLATCPRCAADLAWLKRAIALMRSDDSQDAPPWAIARAVGLFRSRAEQAAPLPNLRERVLARLRLDSAQRPLALGLRTGQAAARQLLFGAGEHDLDIRLTPAGSAWVVSGQVLGAEASGSVELRGEAIRMRAGLNDLSEFALPPVPAGRYALILRLAEAEIAIADLEVGAT
jgi:anti-sigma factor RsiW